MESGTQRALKDRQRLMQLIEIYAIRTRRLLEAIAVLGGDVSAQKPIDESMIEIQKLRQHVEQAGADLFAFVGQRPEESSKQ
jgi:hypothetical protein